MCLITQTSRAYQKMCSHTLILKKISFGKNTLFFRNNIIFKDFLGGQNIKQVFPFVALCFDLYLMFELRFHQSLLKVVLQIFWLFEQNLFISATCISSCLTAALCLLSTASKHRMSCWFYYQRCFEGSPEATGCPFLSPLILVITALNEAGIHCVCFSLTRTVFSSHFTK